jgi:endonuclease/exonuclease/phosphatase family metal-dependent hydrolase
LRRAKTLHADQSRLIADYLDMTFEFHPTVKRKDEHFGDAILSKHPMTLVRATNLSAGTPPYSERTPRRCLDQGHHGRRCLAGDEHPFRFGT